jgi:hypothetical protein
VRYENLNSRGRERLDEMIRQLSRSSKPKCEDCVSGLGHGRWNEEYGTHEMPVNEATCIVWITDRRAMVDLSHLSLSCDYHLDFYPYPTTVDYGNGPRPNEHGNIRVMRDVVWPEAA